jgi:uncharacterized metal-binding protein YceD (DUF177 family)
MAAYGVNIVGLSNKKHHFDYEIGEKFFGQYGSDFLSEGLFHADVELTKHETFIEAEFKLKGVARLICDRSLEPFDFPVERAHKIVFKFGDTNQELSDEIIMISRDTAVLELGQYIYEFLVLALPMKRLHPRFRDAESNDDNPEGKIVYSSKPDEPGDQDEIDPRWNILKKLK